MSSFALPGPLSLGGMAVPNRLVAGMHDQDVMLYVVPLLSDNGYLEGHLRAGNILAMTMAICHLHVARPGVHQLQTSLHVSTKWLLFIGHTFLSV